MEDSENQVLVGDGVPAGQENPVEKAEGMEAPLILEEVHVERVTIDGICGVY